MLKLYVKTRDAMQRLRTDKDGVVSVEYVIVAACIVGMVVAVFGGGATGILGAALTGGIGAIAGAITGAV
jgi:Flp pilus assembly pilin Flp